MSVVFKWYHLFIETYLPRYGQKKLDNFFMAEDLNTVVGHIVVDVTIAIMETFLYTAFSTKGFNYFND